MKHWIAATRPKTLAAGIIPVLVGTCLGAAGADIQMLPALACLCGALGIQIACNFANDAIDALKGTDNDQRLGPTRAVASGALSASAMLRACALVLALSFCIGLYLSAIGGWPIFILGVISLCCAYGYTGGPFPLAYLGIGDVFVLLFFGFFAVLGSAYIQMLALAALAPVPTDALSYEVGLLHLPWAWWFIGGALGLQACAIIAVNNLRDRHGDAMSGKRTFSVRCGRTASLVYIFLLHITASGAFFFADHRLSAGVALGAGMLLSTLLTRRDGAALNVFLGLFAGLELLCGALVIYTLYAHSP